MNLFDNQNNNQQGVNDYFQSQGQNGTNFGNMNNQNNFGNNMNGLDPQKVLISKIFIGWFIGTLLLILITAYSGHRLISVMLFGQFFLVIGIALLKKNNFDIKKIGVFFLFPVVGLFMIVVPFLKLITQNSFDFGSVILFATFILGAGIMILPNWRINQLKKHCTVRINAKIVDVVSGWRNHRRVYFEVYEYSYMGQTYTQRYDESSFDDRVIGQYREIFISPNEPTLIYREGGKVNSLLYIIFGLMFMLPSLLAMFSH